MEHRDAKGPGGTQRQAHAREGNRLDSMTPLSVGRERLDTLAPNRVLRAIPPAVVALDLAIVTASVILAALGRVHFAMFGRSLTEISGTLALVGPLMVLGWIVAIGLGGGYSNSALGGRHRRVQAGPQPRA